MAKSWKSAIIQTLLKEDRIGTHILQLQASQQSFVYV